MPRIFLISEGKEKEDLPVGWFQCLALFIATATEFHCSKCVHLRDIYSQGSNSNLRFLKDFSRWGHSELLHRSRASSITNHWSREVCASNKDWSITDWHGVAISVWRNCQYNQNLFIPMYTLVGFYISPPPLQCFLSHFNQHLSHFPISNFSHFPYFQFSWYFQFRLPLSLSFSPFLHSFCTSNILHPTSVYHPHFVPFTSLFSFLPAVLFLFLVQQLLSAMFRLWFCTIFPILPIRPFF